MRKGMFLIVVVSLTVLITAAASANTIDSSTMYFQGTLIYDSSTGAYLGTIQAVAGPYYSPGGPGTTEVSSGVWETPDGEAAVGGFDVYGKNGATATINGATPTIVEHDAYHESGPWGSWYDPDVADWDHYTLTLTETGWEVKYNGITAPLSGSIDWNLGYAYEDEQNWNATWSWGTENIPLEFAGFRIEVNELAPDMGTMAVVESTFVVSLTPSPVPEPGTILLLGVGLIGLVGLRKKFKKS